MSLSDIRQTRIEKLDKLKKAGVNPYPAKSFRTHQIAGALSDFDHLAAQKKQLVLAGRTRALREHGGSTFLDVADHTGKIQIYFKKDVLGPEAYGFFLETVDIGDFLEVSGFLFKTQKGEPTLEAASYRILAKSLLPLPEKWHGLQDIEERFRKRYLDLIFNPEVKEKLAVRTKIVKELRRFLDKHDFIEVETPILQVLAGGANAKPFKTKLNTLNLNVYLRIAPELFLKRLLIGGFDRVYEIGKSFRNEGVDRDHNPEFTSLEFYAAYHDYQWLMEFTEKLLVTVITGIFGSSQIYFDNRLIEFSGPYQRISFDEILEKYTGLPYDQISEKTLAGKARALGLKIEKVMTKGNIADEIYKKLARPDVFQPTFVINHPLDISPLSKNLDHSRQAARFQLLVAGNEIINAFSELNDPLEQRDRFTAQKKMAKKGGPEAHPFDEEFIEALEYGMPPAAGWGLGIDRLAAILTNSRSIREVIAFPLMKPR